MKIDLKIIIIVIVLGSCTQNSGTEKYQNRRECIINVREKINEIDIGDVYISNISWPYLLDHCLIIMDYKGYDKLIHIFNKDDFTYLTGIANRGKGPGEIANIGHIATDEKQRKFYVKDSGKQRIFSYSLDSVLFNPAYLPEVKMEMNIKRFPLHYQYVNDTLCIGTIMEPAGISDFSVLTAKWNMSTGEITLMKYTHPKIEKKRISIAVSMEHGIYAECYHHHDLMTICSIDGELKFNIYGSKWDCKKTNEVKFYGDAAFCKDKILVLYSSGKHRTTKDGKTIIIYPTQFLVFDTDGNYLQTLETEYELINFCYDQENNRIIMHMNEEMQFAYLNLDGII